MHTQYIFNASAGPKVSNGSSFYSKSPLRCCNLNKQESQDIIHSCACWTFPSPPRHFIQHTEERLTAPTRHL